MFVHSASQRKTHIRVPQRKTIGRTKQLGRALLGSILSPIYWLLAYRHQVPGLKFRKVCAGLAFRLLFARSEYISFAEIYRLLFWPLDSVRYFEFDFAWDALSNLAIRDYLDVSSPRLFPIMLTLKKGQVHAELMNPDVKDRAPTADLVNALGLDRRCNIHPCVITAASFEQSSFDVVTSISVVEHIPEDNLAVRKMWDLVRPGGRLLLTVPCAAEAREEYIDQDEYGLLAPNEDGFFFFQRYYDQELLERSFYSITGRPYRSAVYGEKIAGTYHRDQHSKRSDPNYPLWREPYMMGREYRYFDTVSELPGVGVIAMEFVKA